MESKNKIDPKAAAHASVPLHVVHELIARMTAAPELKQVLTAKLKNRDHSQSLKLAEVEKVFKQLKFERAGSHDAFHIDQLHKTLTAHLGTTSGAPGSLGGGYVHPSLPHH